ncbi:MAG TPA: rhodanese-like domain-containing protein [Thermoanaerobaculia bacterium]|nr:rhodanese-like domain-containing protein [Thermoanaerobaculia bacterium]
MIFQTHAAELARRLRYAHPPLRVLDVRDRALYEAGHLPSAIHVPGPGPRELPHGAGTEYVVVGEEPGEPAVRAASLALQRLGARRIVELSGGMAEWRRVTATSETTSASR